MKFFQPIFIFEGLKRKKIFILLINMSCLPNNNLIIDTLCLGGGGSSGLGYIGTIEILEKKDWFSLENLENFVSTSVGSIISFFLVLGYSTNEIKDFLLMFDLNKIEPKIDCINLFRNYGLDDGEKIIEIAKSFLFEKFNIREISFQKLFEMTNKRLRIIVTNYTKSETEILDYKTQPDMSVFLAIRMSMSLPFIFTPVIYKGCYYIDGGLLKNFGIELCNPKTTIGISSLNSSENKLDSLINYVNGLCQIFFTSANKRIENHKYFIIRIQSGINDSIDFTFDRDRKYNLINKGKESAYSFFEYIEVRNTMEDILNKIR